MTDLTHPFPAGTVLGYPRIGPRRELKKALEAFWAGRASAEEVEATAADLRRRTRTRLAELGLDTRLPAIPSAFSFYDHVLDAATVLGAVPERFADLVPAEGGLDLAGYSTVARGRGDDLPLEMTKWFDSNYHYLVPEIGPATAFRYASDRPVRELAEGLADGVLTRPVLVGPVTFLALAKAAEGAPADFSPIDRLADVLPVYAELLRDLARAGATWVQLDEPALVSDSTGVPADRLLPPSAEHLFGTDHLGRDVWTRVVHGASLSLRTTALAVVVGLVVGSALGLLAGFLRGWVDDVVGRAVDVLLAVPSILLSLAIITALGTGPTKIAVAVGVGAVATFARVMRAEVLRTSTSVYVEAARASGARWWSVLGRHVLPNSAGPVLALVALEFGGAVLAVSALSFLGYGTPPPTPEWGSLISGGRDYLATAWWLTTLPGLVIVAVVLSANRVARALETTGEDQ